MEADVEAARLKMKEATDAVDRARYASAGATRTASHEVVLFFVLSSHLLEREISDVRML